MSTATIPDAAHPSLLSPTQRATLVAVARRMAPAAFASEDEAALPALVEAKIAALPPHLAGDLRTALTLFGSRGAVLATVGVPLPFAALSPVRQDRMLARWESSRVAVQRTVFQGLRRIVLAVWYAQPAAQRAIGYLGPLHERGPAMPWEGPMPAAGAAPADGPVAHARQDSSGAAPGAPVPDEREPDVRAPRPRHPLPAGVITAHVLGGDRRLAVDAVVIGTGAGGAVAAARLAERGKEVVILEAGSWHEGSDFTEHEAAMTERLYADAGARATDDASIPMFQGTSVGGSTTVNWLIMLRTPDWVLDEWARRHGATGMGPAAMAPVFARIEAETHAREVPDEAHSPNNRIILDGARALGWRARAATINTRDCVRAGFCGQGCRYGARQGPQAVYLPRALAAGARLFTDADAERIAIVERGTGAAGAAMRGTLPLKRVTAVVRDPVTRAPRGTLTIDAPVVVVAGGAVGTPVLLERSGLGGGGVGEWLRLHPTTPVVGLYDRPIYGAAGIPLSSVCDEFLDAPGSGYGFWLECPPLHPSLGAVATQGFGEAHARDMARFTNLGVLIALVRDGAETHRSSGSVHLSRSGRVRLRYRLTPTDAAQLRAAMAAAARLHLAAGATEARTLHARRTTIRPGSVDADLAAMMARSVAPNDVALFSAHVNGTCRLGTDARTSGATPDGERWGAPGVYVADGSLLPTALGVNPQETIMAVATVIAERIR